jgi:hypothetical protein
MRFFWQRNRASKHSAGGSGESPSTDSEPGSPFAGAWEGPWEGAGARWLYPMGGQAWLQIAADGTIAAQISTSGGEVSQWQGEILETGDIRLEESAAGDAFGSAHGEGQLVRAGNLRLKLLIGGIAPTPFDAEFDLTRRRG